MATAITGIMLVHEADFATTLSGQQITFDGRHPLTPHQIVDVLIKLDPQDLDAIHKELNRRRLTGLAG